MSWRAKSNLHFIERQNSRRAVHREDKIKTLKGFFYSIFGTFKRFSLILNVIVPQVFKLVLNLVVK